MILAGDIGGTKTVLARYERTSGGLQKVREEIFKSKEHASLESIVERFRGSDAQGFEVACFGVAGPVVDGECRTTNLPWLLREDALAQALSVRRVKLLNDLEAAAYGMLHLTQDQVLVLQPAERTAPGTVAVLAAGTGLGEAVLHWDGTRHLPMASEGGHATFAPQNDEDFALLRFLQARHGDHVSWERVVSGPGFLALYEFFRDHSGIAESPAVRERLARENPGAVITELGLRGDDALCRRTVETFARHYGAEAGNLALKCLAIGGVFLGGNIATILFPALREPFLKGFLQKGRFGPLLAKVSVQVALDPKVPLTGAAQFGAWL